ncbi:MAG: hypothetical protein LBQ90_09925, partial [Synergistaceae bacterium]|nr:hypothetical protein [Synergistaceae bacterium]
MIVRAIKIEDTEDMNRMRTMNGVRENILGIMSERVIDSVAIVPLKSSTALRISMMLLSGISNFIIAQILFHLTPAVPFPV